MDQYYWWSAWTIVLIDSISINPSIHRRLCPPMPVTYAAPCYELWTVQLPAMTCDLCNSFYDLWPVQILLWTLICAASVMTCDLCSFLLCPVTCAAPCYDLLLVQLLQWPVTLAAPAMTCDLCSSCNDHWPGNPHAMTYDMCNLCCVAPAMTCDLCSPLLWPVTFAARFDLWPVIYAAPWWAVGIRPRPWTWTAVLPQSIL